MECVCHIDGDIPEPGIPGTLGSWAVGRGLLPGSPWAGEEEDGGFLCPVSHCRCASILLPRQPLVGWALGWSPLG